MTDLIVLDERSAATQPQVTRYQALFNPIALSALFGTAVATAGATYHLLQNRAFGLDATVLYAVVQDGVYKSTDSGATFVLDNAFTIPAVATDDLRLTRTGIHYAFDGSGTTYLTGVFVNTGGFLVGWRLNLVTDAFEETVSAVAAVAGFGDEYLFNNVLHFVADVSTTPALRSWDPIGQSFASFAAPAPGVVTASGTYAVLLDGALYFAFNDGGSANTFMAKFSGVWTDLGNNYSTHAAVVDAAADLGQRFALFTDPTTGDAIVFSLVEDGGTVGYQVTQIPSPFTAAGVAIQTTVLAGHAALLTAGDGGSGTNVGDKRLQVIVDTETTPGGVRVYLAFGDDSTPGTPWTIYEWQGVGGPITLFGVGGDVGNALPSPVSGGAGFYTPGQLKVRFLTPVRVGVVGGQELTFVASGGGLRTIRFRKAKVGGSTGGSQAKLIGPVTGGGTLGADEVNNHPADGVTVGKVTWNLGAEAPSFAAGEANTVLVPEISV